MGTRPHGRAHRPRRLRLPSADELARSRRSSSPSGLGLSGVTLALALDGPALVVGWSAEAAILAWVARTDRRTARPRLLVCFPRPRRAARSARRGATRGAARRRRESGQAHRRRPQRRRLRVRHRRYSSSGRDLWMALLAVAAVAFVYAASLLIVDVHPGRCGRALAERAGHAEHLLGSRRARGAIVVGLGARRPRAALRRACAARDRRCEGLRATTWPSSTNSIASSRSSWSGVVLLAGAYAYQRVRAVEARRT